MHMRKRVLGGDFEFDSNSRALLDLADVAYRRLPGHRFPASPPRLQVSLRLRGEAGPAADTMPPEMKMHAGGGMLCGSMNPDNFATIAPALRSALVVVSPGVLRQPYYARYELMEFAVFTLASRTQGLVPLHAACVERNGQAVLLVGRSGAGKSTVALHCLQAGLRFISEDSTFVEPRSMQVTGVANFLHLREDSLALLRPAEAARIRKSPVIRRRSGIEKFEIDMRQTAYTAAPVAPRLAGIVFLSSRSASRRRIDSADLLTPIDKPTLRRLLSATQSYAAGQPPWTDFLRRAVSLPAFELQRGDHPAQSATAVLRLLEQETAADP